MLWVWVFGAIAVLFNPVLPVRMARQDWQVVNVITAMFFISWITAAVVLKKREQ
jgi:hypothetical protein